MHIQLGAAGCDIALTMQGELQYIWKHKWLVDGAEQVPKQHCGSVLFFQVLAFSSMLVLLELVLILRVFALYDRNRAIGIFLSLLLVLRITSSTHSVYHHVLQFPEKTQFTNHCVPSVNYRDAHSPVWVIMFVQCGVLSVQLAIITLNMKRTVWDFRQYSHLLFSVLNKDGLRVFGAIAVAVVATAATVIEEGGTSYLFVFPIFIPLISAAGCHTILNLQKLELELAGPAGNSSDPNRKDIEFTTIDDVDIITWDAPWNARTFQVIEGGSI
ncbi:hypothetical protein BDP27DRAFT_1365857 [Rhodocollybia butyracea]|uniref:Uncharacterized protein n=1 Tax=Rhodocollybia butyracea TaxID=206335 RepID=A0A9P5PQ87_9AGAR|nr:hypothetical protein BDP27DRAFT_1365857 [Rhodocollybia butyracea]